MCRMFAYSGDSRNDLEMLHAALKSSAEDDSTITWSDDRQHRDGWGCVIFTKNDLIYYRSETPIFDDESFEIPEFSGAVHAIFHARKASPNTPVGASIFSHPFTASIESKLIFLAHNGGIRGPRMNNLVDSELALKVIAEAGSLEKSLPELKSRTATALNLMLLSIDRASRKAELKCFNYWVKEGRDEYYRMYSRRMSGGSAVFSSTLKTSIGGTACKTGKIISMGRANLV
jgi:predicted glutamine amidotransferase